MPGFKFHIVTVVGIFVALALGIVIGTSLSDNIIIESQMSTIELMQNRINSLEVERSNLTEQTQRLAEDIKILRNSEDKLFAIAAENYNDIENITVIAMGESLELQDLELVKSNKLYFENIVLINPDNLDSEGLRLFLGVENNVEEVFSEKLANFIHHNDDTSIKYLEQLEIISVSGDYNFSNQKIIVYFSGEDLDRLLGITIERLYQLNQRVYAVTDLGNRALRDLNININQIAYITRSTSQIELLQLLDEEVRMVISDWEE